MAGRRGVNAIRHPRCVRTVFRTWFQIVILPIYPGCRGDFREKSALNDDDKKKKKKKLFQYTQMFENFKINFSPATTWWGLIAYIKILMFYLK